MKENNSNEKHVKTNEKYVPGDSVEKHKTLEDANSYLASKEIKQQNENL
ncbi:hypothetical protein ACUXCC_004247 [Cytobacillus horneckiae]|nr:hypothetical protein [Cytobacillus horneckiae]MBN6886864.1 hypothetical protein [Cytobacillus horneckiae]MCM3177667.1 hypothetical protein [Cytobacillus horneckiae]MEC1157975.1 hypothetical protein [Cytobacillus horneckiae]MED2937100.1 hypothetical protein [Cytobacillus horneckiae]